MTKYIFVVGGVMSGVGKGVTVSSIGAILKARGFNVTAIKVDPYINIDAGTMNPTEHGEVFVLSDGDETDQDMGNYERFMQTILTRDNYMTTGRVYQSVIQKERNLEYNGKCVEVVPHIPLEVIRRIEKATKLANADITIIEIGGTVGEYQNILFLEAARMMKLKHPADVLFAMVSYLPIPSKVGEMKTKPTQYAVRSLNSAGIQPDIIIARSDAPLDTKRKEKLSMFCNISQDCVVSAPDVESIYEIPLNFEKDNLSSLILKKLSLKSKASNLDRWRMLNENVKHPRKSVRIAVVGKYFATGNFVLGDAYISVIEAVKHASYALGAKPIISWIDSEDFENNPEKAAELSYYDGIIIPGGFGSRGVEGKIKAIRFVREHDIPFLGLCYGMQLAVIEFARNICGMKGANTTENDSRTPYPVIDIIPSQKQLMKESHYGGTMRLGSYLAALNQHSQVFNHYKNSSRLSNDAAIISAMHNDRSQLFRLGIIEKNKPLIIERHRHRYEVNPNFTAKLESKGLLFSGYHTRKEDGQKLVEFMELPENRFHIGTQAHPEFRSSPLRPAPLFLGFIRECLNK